MNKTTDILRARLKKEETALDLLRVELDRYVRLPRKRWFSTHAKEQATMRRISALKTALQVAERPFRDVDIYQGCLFGIPERHECFEEALSLAGSVYLNERARAARMLFNVSLPVAKRQIMEMLEQFPE